MTDDPNELITVTLRRGQWMVIHDAAGSYDKRVPLEQGDGGECLDVIQAALNADRSSAAMYCECDNPDRGLYRYRSDRDWWSCEQCDGRVRPLTDEEKADRD